MAGHPLLDGLVLDEVDFASGDLTASDTVGHGTHVAGVVVYGDILDCLENNTWEPSVNILSGKVMKGNQLGEAVFADERRVELQISEAVRYFHEQYGCRVFNLSIGHPQRPFAGGRQHPWALALDGLARELDIVIIVPTGNQSPEIPVAVTTPQLHEQVRDNLYSDLHRLVDPACASIALTVGSLAHDENGTAPNNNLGTRNTVGAPMHGPSPFTRVGLSNEQGVGLHKAIKPELVAYGGNLKVEFNTWNDRDPKLGVASLNFDYQRNGLLLRSAPGTSFAAPYVTHVCARLEAHLRRSFTDLPISANLIRALVVHSAKHPDETLAWLQNGQPNTEDMQRVLRVSGYGIPDITNAMYSADNRVTLVTQEEIEDDHFHLYELELPDLFVNAAGQRLFKVTLAYDPPVRQTRKEYLARTLWFEAFRGLTPEQIVAVRSNISVDGGMPVGLRNSSILGLNIAKTSLQWSTVQSGFKTSRDRRTFSYRPDPAGPAKLHILVGSQRRFDEGSSNNQRYALVVTLGHSEDVNLHQSIRQQLRQRVRVRV